jgi:hypothetical protein
MKINRTGLAVASVLLVITGIILASQSGLLGLQSQASIANQGSSGGADASSTIRTFNLLDNEDGCNDSTFDICYRNQNSYEQAEADAIVQADYIPTIEEKNGVNYVEEGTDVEYACGENGENNDGIYHDTYVWYGDGDTGYEWDKDDDNEIEGVPEPVGDSSNYRELNSDEGELEVDYDEATEVTISCISYQSHWSGAWTWASQAIDYYDSYRVAPDSDNDGVYDFNDECPNKAGQGFGVKENGCPVKDSDGDGIPDKDDDCPQKAGVESAGGCPDADGDGVRDSNDAFPRDDDCQDDSDGDSVCDSNDAFPNDPSRQADADGDGVADSNDLCPASPAGANGINGCPDSDGDGVKDELDSCPTTGDQGFGVKDNGCPVEDTDGDGVGDNVDVCSGTPQQAQVDDQGCAVDGDNDGVPDYKDQCSDTPEDTTYGVDAQGCAIEDADADGVADSVDQCPQTFGSKSNGCPSFFDNIINFLGLRGVF